MQGHRFPNSSDALERQLPWCTLARTPAALKSSAGSGGGPPARHTDQPHIAMPICAFYSMPAMDARREATSLMCGRASGSWDQHSLQGDGGRGGCSGKASGREGSPLAALHHGLLRGGGAHRMRAQ